MKTKQWLFAALTVLLLAGCSTETDLTRTDDVDPPIPEGMTQLNFEIKGVRTGTSYVALTKEEAQLRNLSVVLFTQSESGPRADAVCVASCRAKITTKDGAYKAAVLMDKTIPAGKYYAVLLANIEAMFGNLRHDDFIPDDELDQFLSKFIGKTYNETLGPNIDALFPSASSSEVSTTVANWGLGMTALVKDINVTEADRGDVIPLSATLTRLHARFDIKNSAYKSFTITGYQLKSIRIGTYFCFLDSDVMSWDDIPMMDDDYLVNFTAEQQTLLNTPSLDHDSDPATPLVMTYNPAFYCYPGQAADQSYVEITGELKLTNGGTRTVTYPIPLKTKTPDEYIAIQKNKRYKIELKMTEAKELEGEVTMDAGSWDDEGGTNGSENVEEQLPGEVLAVAGATYHAATQTFHVPENVNTFTFTFAVSTNPLRKATTDPGIVDKVEEATTLAAPSSYYTVTLATTGFDGAIEEIGKDKEGNEVVVTTYKVKRAGAPVPPADVNGHKPVRIDNFWFVDPSPVGVNNEYYMLYDGVDPCPVGWRLPTSAELIDVVGAIGMKAPFVDPLFPAPKYNVTKNADFEERLGVLDEYGILCSDGCRNDEGHACFDITDDGQAFWDQTLTGGAARCVQLIK